MEGYAMLISISAHMTKFSYIATNIVSLWITVCSFMIQYNMPSFPTLQGILNGAVCILYKGNFEGMPAYNPLVSQSKLHPPNSQLQMTLENNKPKPQEVPLITRLQDNGSVYITR